MFGLKNVLVIHYVLNSNFFIWFVELNGLTITPDLIPHKPIDSINEGLLH